MSTSEWLPIETAPKDGTPVLLYYDGVVTQGAWNAEDYARRWEAVTLEQHGCGCCAGTDDPPKHWMPLPAPPSPES